LTSTDNNEAINAEITSSNPVRGMDLYPRISVLCCPVDRDPEMGQSPSCSLIGCLKKFAILK